jgi:hypothetical protein
VKFSADSRGLDRLAADLTKLARALTEPAVEAATDALASTVAQSRQEQALDPALIPSGEGPRRLLGASDRESIARELGSLDFEATPWLAPSLPAARGPMRAAVHAAVARAISSLRFKSR